MGIPGLSLSEPSMTRFLREILQSLANPVKIGQISSVIQDFGIPDLAGFVDHERSTFGNSLSCVSFDRRLDNRRLLKLNG